MSATAFEAAKKKTSSKRVDSLKEKTPSVLAEQTVMHAARIPASLSKAVKLLAVEEETSIQELTIKALRNLIKEYES